MGLFKQWLGLGKRLDLPEIPASESVCAILEVERLEDRNLMDANGVLAAGTLTVMSAAPSPFERIGIFRDAAADQLVLTNFGNETARFASAAVANISIVATANDVQVRVDPSVFQPTTITASNGTILNLNSFFNGINANAKNVLLGGGGPTTFVTSIGVTRAVGGAGAETVTATQGLNYLVGGNSTTAIASGGFGFNRIYGAMDRTTITGFNALLDVNYQIPTTPPDLSSTLGLTPSPNVTLTATDVQQLLDRASAATPSNDAIIVIVDRGGRILGVRTEAGVDPGILADPNLLTFAIDGAVAEARTGAFFGNNQAPLTSRTVGSLSQTTMTEQEINSNPSITDVNSTARGPGFVADIGIKDHFPAGVANTPQVDLFDIEATNRDSSYHPATDQIKGTADDTFLLDRFNINPAFIPASIPLAQQLAAPDSYGFASGIAPTAQNRGLGTLPGGIPIYKTDPVTGQAVVVGGIGVFFPGKTGFATEENSSTSSTYDPTKADRTLEAEFIAFAAVGGAPGLGSQFAVGTLGGIAPVAGITLPITPQANRIDLVGITLDIIGPTGTQGPQILLDYANANLAPGTGTISGVIQPLLNPGLDNKLNPAANPAYPAYTPTGLIPTDTVTVATLSGTFVPEGFLVTPHASKYAGGLSATDVQQMIQQGVNQAVQTRAAIRLPFDQNTVMVFAVADLDGEILGLFRMPDSTVFSIDVAVSKSRNVGYYANTAALNPQDQLAGIVAGTAFTSRTFRYLALPRFPEGVDGNAGPFSIINDGNVNVVTAMNTGAPLPASAYQSVQGHDAFNPQTNFHYNSGPFYDPLNQSGIVFFPGAVPLYRNGVFAGGLGVSGDGVDQDDVMTFAAKQGFDTPANVLRSDEVFFQGIRLPYQKFNRQPQNY